MAQGSFVKYIRSNKEYVKVWWESTPVSGSNSSKVSVYAKMYRPYSISSTSEKDVTLTVAGKTFKTTRAGWGGVSWTNKFAVANDVIVNHDSDGTKEITISLKLELGLTLSGTYYDNISMSQKCKLDNLNVKSTFTTNYTSVKMGNSSFTVTLNRSSSTVRHRISYVIGKSPTQYILKKVDDDGKTNKFTHTFSASKLLQYINSKSTQVTIVCETFKNASSTTAIGKTIKTITLNLSDNEKPQLTAGNISVSYNPVAPNTITDGYVIGHSKAKFTIAPTLASGTAGAIAKYVLTYLGKVRTYTNADSIVFSDLTMAGKEVSVYVVDKRGMESEPVIIPFTAWKYTVPVISKFQTTRCNTDGTSNNNGTSIKISIMQSYTSCGGGNSTSIQLYYRPVGNSEYEALGGPIKTTEVNIERIYDDFPTSNSFEFKAEIIDSITTVSIVFYSDVGTEEMLIDVAPKGVAIGKVSERSTEDSGAFEVGWNAYFDGDIYIGGKSLKGLLGIE